MSTHWKSARSIVIVSTFIVLSSGAAFAFSCHGGDSQMPSRTTNNEGMSHNMSMMSMAPRPVQSVDVGGMRISLDVMDMAMHAHMQAMKQNPLPGAFDTKKSHAIMITIKDLATNNAVKNDTVTITVVSPSGASKTEKAIWSGDHYGESFNPSESGSYKIRVKAVDTEGKGREAEFKYKKS